MTQADYSPLLLSHEEVQEVTGFKMARLQVAWLQRKGWRFEVNGTGRPVVARKYAEKMLGCGHDDEQRPRPNFGALLRPV